ncbi:MAG: transporter substrate-binding domain-containing protein [Methylococcales bacterium]
MAKAMQRTPWPVLLYLLLSLIGSTSSIAQPDSPIPGSSSESRQTIYRIAIDHSFPPFTMINTQGEPAGLFVDLWRVWAETNGYQIEFHSGEWSQTLAMLKRGEVDFHSGMLATKERRKWIDFSREFYETSSAIYTIKGEPLLEDIQDLAGRKVGVFKTSYHEDYLRKRTIGVKVVTFTTSREMIRATLDRKIDGFFAEIPLISQVLVRKGLAESLRHGSQPIVTEPFFAGVRKGNAALLELINQGLENISQDQLIAIEKRWIPDPVSYFFDTHTLAPEISLTPAEKQWIRSHSVIRLGSDTMWPPFEFTDKNGQHKGICVDYMALLARRLSLDIKLQPTPPLPELIKEIGFNKLDGAACLSKTKIRETALTFTEPYINASSVIITRINQDPVKNVAEFNGKIVAVEEGYYPAEKLAKEYPEIKLHIVADTASALQAVSTNTADAYVGNMAVATWYLEQEIITNLKINGPEIEQGQLRVGIRKEWPQLVKILQKGLDSITIQEKKAIQRKWIPIAKDLFRAGKRARLSPEEMQFVLTHPVITFSETQWEPLHSISGEGQPYGMSIDFLNLVSEKTGLRFQYTPVSSWTEVVDGIRNGSLDMAPAMGKTKTKEAYAQFSEPYLSFPLIIVTRDDVTYIKDTSELDGKKVLVGSHYTSQEFLAENYPDIVLLPVPDVSTALKKLAAGEAFALVANMATATYHIQQLGLTNLKISGTTEYEFDIRAMVREGLPELVSIINKGLAAITEEERNFIYHKWLPIQYKSQVDTKLAWTIVAIATAIIALALFWNWIVQRQKAALRVSEERFHLAMEASDDGLWDWNIQTGEVYFSPGYMKMLGYDPRELAANHQTWAHLLHPEDKLKAVSFTENAIATVSKHYEHEFRLKTKSGSYVDIHSSGSVVAIDREGHATRAVGTQRDVTQRKQVAKELNRAKKDAEQASQFKSDFLANMSHEIRTPMNAVIGLSHLALQTNLTAKQRDYLAKIQGSSENLLTIINDILDFSKIEAGKLQLESVEFPLDEIFNNLADLFRQKADEKSIEVIFDINNEVPKKLIGDPLRLQQVLINLTSNALKFTESGEVIIGVRLVNLQQRSAVFRFFVKDTGIGLSEEQISRLFQAFHQADQTTTRHYGGSGLGLAISKKLVGLMNGKLGVESNPGKGSTFFFTIKANIPEETEQTNIITVPTLEGLKVLVVSDHPSTQKALCSMLTSFSCEANYTDNADLILDLVKSADPPYQIVLLDQFFRSRSKGNFADQINELASLEPKVFAIVAAHEFEAMPTVAIGLVDSFLIKPVDPSQLFNALLEFLYSEDLLQNPKKPEGKRAELARLKGDILLVEDNLLNQQVAGELLGSFGLSVDFANNGLEALTAVREKQYDMVFMDIQMPELDGLDATRLIRDELGQTKLPIIAMTANAMVGDNVKSTEAGMNNHITKPIDPDEVYREVQRWIPQFLSEDNRKPRANPPQDESSIPPYTDPESIEQAVARIGGNRKLLSQLLQDFYVDHYDDKEKIRAALQSGDTKTVKRLIHTIKGIAGNIGAVELAESAEYSEKLALNDTSSDLDSTMQKLYSELDDLMASLGEATAGKMRDGKLTTL